MRPTYLRIALVVILGIALVLSVGLNLRQFRQLAVSREMHEADAQALRNLQEALHHREQAPAPAAEEGSVSETDLRAALARRDATLAQLSQALATAQSTITDLQSQLAETRDQNQKALADLNDRDQKDKDDWQARLSGLQQQLDSAQADLQSSHQQIDDLKTANTKLKRDLNQGDERTADFARILADLQDLDRRRDTYLTSIMRRYRDITSQFRAMGGMLESNRDPNSGAFSSAELTRIQNAIAQAEDDLRQLSDLNARARQLEKKLAMK